MQNRPPYFILKNCVCLVSLSLLLVLSESAFANIDPPTGPAVSADGNYTITFNADIGSYYCSIDLEEKVPGTSYWQYTGDTGHGILVVQNKPPGIYEYRVYAECEDYYGEQSWDIYSSSISVQVGEAPTVDSLMTQLQYEYETRIGDINNDGRTDIFVHRTTVADDGNGSIKNLLMWQQQDGTFISSSPTGSQESIASGWPLADIYLEVMDANLDGFADIFMPELSEVIPSALDQIVFASGQIYQSSPMGTTAIDSTVSQFLDEFRSWTDSPTYFEDNAIWVEEPGYWDWVVECDFYWWGDSPEIECEYYQEWVDGDEYLSYGHFNQDALALADQLGLQAPSYPSQIPTSKGSIIESIFERVFGVGVFGGVLSGGGIGSWEIDFGLGPNDRGLTLNILIYDIAEKTDPKDWRHYTLAEKAFLFGNGFDIPNIDKVKIFRKEYGPAKLAGRDNQVIAPNGNIYIPPGNSAFGVKLPWSQDYLFEDDFSLMTFLHESFHVYQKRERLNFPGVFWLKAANNEYFFEIEPGKDFFDYGLEQEATIIMARWYLYATGNHTTYNTTATKAELDALIPFTCYVCL